jgi:hypothetical protein
MRYTIEHSSFHKKPPCLLTNTPYTCSRNQGFYPIGHIDWFNNPIPAPDSFEEGNMANISPTIKIDISIKNGIVEEITIGAACTPQEIIAYKSLFQEYQDILLGHTQKCLALIPLSSNITSTLGLTLPQFVKK